MRWTLLFLAACSKSPPPAPAATVDAAPVVTASAPIVEAGPKIQQTKVSFASFDKNVLNECADVVINVPEGKDAGLGDPKKLGPKGSTPLKDECARQFPGKTVLATCEIDDTKNDAGIELSITSNRYDYGTLSKNDSAMKDCAESGGRWTQVPANGPVWRRARLEHLQRLAGKMQEPEP